MKDKYCVVIPAFNACRTIGNLVANVRRQGLAVLVVDDGSNDNTAGLATANGAIVLSHVRNQGKGSALRTGFRHAVRSSYDGVVTLDGDGQHDPDEILRLIDAGERQHAGIVVGNRMVSGSMPPLRRWTNQMMSHVVSFLTRQFIPDSQCGFRVIRREVLLSVSLTTTCFEIESELLLAASRRKWKMISVPIRSIYHNHGSYIQPLQDGLRFLHLVLRYLTKRI